jgi:hypothetical protein
LTVDAFTGVNREHDPGFLGSIGEGVRSSALLHAAEHYDTMAGNLVTKDMYADAAEYEEGYEWRADADNYEGLYPREIFEGSGSAGQSRRAMARFDEEMYRSVAISRRPVAAFIGNMVGFGVDLAALRPMDLRSAINHTKMRRNTAVR